MKYIKYASLLLSIAAHGGGPDPNVVNAAGGTLKNNTYNIDFAVGEVAINSIGSHTLGFLQPVKSAGPLALKDQSVEESSIMVYPNPVTNKIYWNIADKEVKKVIIFAASGVKLFEAESSISEINMENLNSGLYYIQFLDSENKLVSNFKLIKN